MAIQKTRGFVLRREDIRETSILLTVYTEDFGKIRLISKGVRSPEQRFISAYELCALNDIVFYEKRTKSYYLLSQCELIDYFPEVRESLDRLAYATYFAELVDTTTAMGESNRDIYGLLFDCMTFLSGTASPKRVARIFEIKLLSLLGLMPQLRSCAHCGKELTNLRARFSVVSGGILCESCFHVDKSAQPIVAGAANFISHIEQTPFEKTKRVKVTKRVGFEVERLLKNFLRYHLDNRLRTMEFIGKVNV